MAADTPPPFTPAEEAFGRAWAAQRTPPMAPERFGGGWVWTNDDPAAPAYVDGLLLNPVAALTPPGDFRFRTEGDAYAALGRVVRLFQTELVPPLRPPPDDGLEPLTPAWLDAVGAVLGADGVWALTTQDDRTPRDATRLVYYPTGYGRHFSPALCLWTPKLGIVARLPECNRAAARAQAALLGTPLREAE